MTLVNINIKNIASETYPDDLVIFRSPTFRESPSGGITSTAETAVPLVKGIGSKELTPGPVVVVFQCRGISDTRPKSGTVPDAGPVSIEDVIAGAFEYTPEVVNNALETIKGAVAAEVDAIKARRGRIPTGQNPDTWKSGDQRQGTWDLDNNSSVNAAISAGYTAPMGNTPHYLQHTDDVDGIGGSYQVATTVSSSGNRIFIRQKLFGQVFQPWREIAIGGSARAFDVQGQPTSSILSALNPDVWMGPEFQGMWHIRDTSTLDSLRSAGYTPPWGTAAHLLSHIESGSDQAVQVAFILGGRSRVLWRQRRYGNDEFDAWVDMSGATESADGTHMIAHGSSFVEGGSHGSLWPESDTWVHKLSQLLGIPIMNAGKGGQRADEIVLRAGRKRTWVKIAGDAIPASGVASIELSWTVGTGGNRWFSQEGTILGESVFLEQNGTTGAWTIRRKTAGSAIPVAGWVEWLSIHERENSLLPTFINLGKNDLTSNISGDYGSPAEHVLAAHQQFVDSLPARAQSLVVLGHFPNLDSTKWVRLQVDAVNEGLATLYPRAYFDVLGFMRDLGPEGALAKMGVTPTPQDEDLVSRGYPPASCFDPGDAGHPNKNFHAVMAARLAERIRNRGLVLPV